MSNYKFENVEFGEHVLYIKDDSGIEIANLPILISLGDKTEQNSNGIMVNSEGVILDLTLSGNTLVIKSISPAKNGSSNNTFLYIIIALLLIGGGIFVITYYFKRKDQKK